jgi:integrase
MAKVTKREGKKGVSWVADYFNPEGQRIRKAFALKKDAEAYLGKVLATKKEGRYHDVFDIKKGSLVTFNELADEYVKSYQDQKSFANVKCYLVDEYRKVFGNRRLSEISFLDLQKYRNQRKATPAKTGKPRADGTINREMSVLRHIFSKAVEWEMLETNPFRKGSGLMVKENNHRLRFLSDAEIEALLKACEDLKTRAPHLKPIVEVALLTGMRREEMLGLKREQIRNGFIYLTETKSNKARQIPIHDRLAQVLKELRQRNQLKSEYVFCDGQGRRVYEVRKSFASACRRAGIKGFRFHDLRHTFASHLVMKGISLKAVQELLGHSDLKMTMRYAHLSQDHLRDAMAVLNNLGCHKTDTKAISPAVTSRK